MTAHVVTDPTATTTPTDPAAASSWLALSAAISDEVPVIADRDDLVVTISPTAGHGAPACFLPALATIEINSEHFGGINPGHADPANISDRRRYAVAWGLLTHECAHAAHSRWVVPSTTPPGVAEAALLLEESRIEAAHLIRRPDDRHWLRTSANLLIVDDIDFTTAPGTKDAARAAGLVLGRVDAGVLSHDETAAVRQWAETALGADTLAALRQVWRHAHAVDDHDAEAMLDLGRQWCNIVGTDPSTNTGPAPAGGSTSDELRDAISTTASAIDHAVATEAPPIDPAKVHAREHAAKSAAQRAATEAAHTVFGRGGPRTGTTEVKGTRPPTAAERNAARTMARALNTAGTVAPARTTRTSTTPPGRLRMRGALAADAQRAAGALPTAEPFIATTRTRTPTPPLRLGIACDVSGSMGSLALPVASTAWMLSHAATLTTVDTSTATVIFGNHVRPVTHPGTPPREVTEFAADDNYEDIATALDALDGALGLTGRDAARLVVIISDGRLRDTPREHGQRRVDRLRAQGCGVLWLKPERDGCRPLDNVTVVGLTDPSATARTIGQAATAALRAAH